MKRTGFFALIALSGLLFAGCGGDAGRVSDLTAPPVTVGGGAQTSNLNLETLEYEELTGTITPGVGGLMGRNLTSWDKNCYFGFAVPPDALSPDSPPVTFSMRIPTKAAYLANPEIYQRLIIRMEPGNVQFQAPITIIGTWMPWQLATGQAPPDPLYYYSGSEVGVATRTYLPATKRWQVMFNVNHFSDWEVGPPRGPAGLISAPPISR